MTYRSHPAPQCPGAGPINAASLMTSAVTCTVEGRMSGQKAPSDHGSQPVGAPHEQHGGGTGPRLTRR